MTVLVAVPEGREGPQALDAGITEARLLATDLVVLNLTLSTIDVSGRARGPQGHAARALRPR